jgi:Fe2+ transport system protein B
MQLDTPYLILVIIAAIVIPLAVMYFIIKAAVSAANKPLERHLKTLIKFKSHTMDRKLYNTSMQEIAMEELDNNRQRYSADEYQRAKTSIYSQFS